MKKTKEIKKSLFTEQELKMANSEMKRITSFLSKDFITKVIELEVEKRVLMNHFNISEQDLRNGVNNYRSEIKKAKKAFFGVDYIPLKPKRKKTYIVNCDKQGNPKYDVCTGNSTRTYKGVKYYEFLLGNKNNTRSVYEIKDDLRNQFNSIDEVKTHIDSKKLKYIH
jgi:hypothetical protein